MALSIGDPGEIQRVGEFDTRGPALDVSLVGERAFIAEGENGVQSLKVADPSSLAEISMETALDSNDARAVVAVGNHLYLADGVHGLKVFDVSDPDKPNQIFHYPADEGVSDVARFGDYLFLAEGAGGGRVIKIDPGDGFYVIGQIEGHIENLFPFDLAPGDQGVFHLVQPLDQGGLAVYELRESFQLPSLGLYEIPGKASLGELVSPLWVTLKYLIRGMFTSLDELVGTFSGRVIRSVLLLLASILGYFFVRSLSFILLSGIILPIRSGVFNREVFRRLRAYLRGQHGPVVFAEKGKEIKKSNFKSRGLGFLRVDTDSAVGLKKRAKKSDWLKHLKRIWKGEKPKKKPQMRTSGPGIEFTTSGESLMGVVDLRKQARSRRQVSAHTRDGIEVNCNVFVGFTVGEDPECLKVTYEGTHKPENLRFVQLGWQSPDSDDIRPYRTRIVKDLLDVFDAEDKREIHRFVSAYQSGTVLDLDRKKDESESKLPYRYNDQRVYSAILSRPFDVFENERKDWTELPAHVAVKIFREMMSTTLYDELYRPAEPRTYPLLGFKRQFIERVRNQGVLAFKFVKRSDGQPIIPGQDWHMNDLIVYPEKELVGQKVLRSRGIKVIFAGFTELRPSAPEVHERFLFEFWRSPWQQEVMITQSDHDLQAMRVRNRARAEAQGDMIYTLSKILNSSTHSREALALRVYQALEVAAADPATQKLLPPKIVDLIERLGSLLTE